MEDLAEESVEWFHIRGNEMNEQTQRIEQFLNEERVLREQRARAGNQPPAGKA